MKYEAQKTHALKRRCARIVWYAACWSKLHKKKSGLNMCRTMRMSSNFIVQLGKYLFNSRMLLITRKGSLEFNFGTALRGETTVGRAASLRVTFA